MEQPKLALARRPGSEKPSRETTAPESNTKTIQIAARPQIAQRPSNNPKQGKDPSQQPVVGTPQIVQRPTPSKPQIVQRPPPESNATSPSL